MFSLKALLIPFLMLFVCSFFLDQPRIRPCYVLSYQIVCCLRRLLMDYSYWEITVVATNHQDRKQEGIFESASYQGCWDVYTMTPVFSSYQEQILILWFFYSWRLSLQFYRWIRSLDPFESVELQRIYSFFIHFPGFFRIFLIKLLCSSVLNYSSILMLIFHGLWCCQHS